MKDEINLILTKLKLVSESEESCAYICDKEHSKILYDYITNLQDTLKDREEYCYGLETQLTNLQEEIKTLYKYTPEKGFELVGNNNE